MELATTTVLQSNMTSSLIAADRAGPTYVIDAIFSAVSLVGIVGNSVAMFIMSSSHKIRDSKSYVLLMNQNLTDLITCILSIIYTLFKYLYPWRAVRGLLGEFVCHVVYNQTMMLISMYCSTLNLLSLSLERTISVVWPIRHRLSFNRNVGVYLCGAMWTLSFGTMLAFSIPVNGMLSSGGGGGCHFWTGFESARLAQLHSVIYNTLTSVLPVMVMMAAYVTIYVSLYLHGKSLKSNVIRMLITCVALFFACHALKVAVIMASPFLERSILDRPIYVVALILLQCNNAVNPFVYSLQYMDYRSEVRRQFNRLAGRSRVGGMSSTPGKSGVGSGTHNSSN